MTATTPSGTLTFSITRPLGRVVPPRILPIGSSSAITSAAASDSPCTRISFSASRSSIALDMPFASAACRSFLFSSRIYALLLRKAVAMADSAASFWVVLAVIRMRLASFAFLPSCSSMVWFLTFPKTSCRSVALPSHGTDPAVRCRSSRPRGCRVLWRFGRRGPWSAYRLCRALCPRRRKALRSRG